MNTAELKRRILSGQEDQTFLRLYQDEGMLEMQRERYTTLIDHFIQMLGAGEVLIFSALNASVRASAASLMEAWLVPALLSTRSRAIASAAALASA